jgi:glycosyltransferase involved in cell wall biosynthesis
MLSCRVLHVPYTYFPDSVGGTEVYVRNLVQGLAKLDYISSVAAPGTVNARYEDEGVPIYRFQTDSSQSLDLAYGIPDDVAARNFRTIVEELRPGTVHLHARTSAVSERLCDFAHEAGARVVFTYHTPTVSCVRGTMMLYGKEPCDGVIERQRCTSCALAALAVPRALGDLTARIPNRLAEVFAAMSKIAKPAAAARIPALIGETRAQFQSFMAKVDHVVALCQWTQDVLARNGVPDEKISLSRHGVADIAPVAGQAAVHDKHGPFRLAYFGRIDQTKGPDLLVSAIAAIPEANVTLDIFALLPPGRSAAAAELETWVAHDRRLTLRDTVAPHAVRQIMTDYDLIAIPSRWLETGPLVALEAFAAGVPVLGADLGGIAESVRNGVDGVLVQPDDVNAWSVAILKLACDRALVDELKRNIRPPRTMNDVARDMAELYGRCYAGA